MTDGYYTIPAGQLGDGAKIPVQRLGDTAEVFFELALDMIRGIKENNAAGRDTVYIVPVGPVGQYPIFVRLVNAGRISLKRCRFINMDEYLRPDGSYIDTRSALSFRGYMEREVYGKLRPELVMPPEQRVFPDPDAPERVREIIEGSGGVDAVFGGVGLNGHLAFNEAEPAMTVDEFSRLGTRTVDIAPATFYANAIGSLNGAIDKMPGRAVTVGMAEILSARKIRLGLFRNWHRAVVRRAAYGPVDTGFPVSLLQTHPDAMLLVNPEAAERPFAPEDAI